MLLSEFLKINGGEKLKKACHIKESAWNNMMSNLCPPSKTISENIVQYLGKKSIVKQEAYRTALWNSILEIQKTTQVLDLTIYIKPHAAPRPRFTKYGRIYNPSSYTDWKKRFSDLLGDIGTITDGCSIQAGYYFEVPSTGRLGYHTNQKDIDNLDKSLLDALQMNGLLEDDKTVYRMDSTKYFSFRDKITLKIFHSGFWTN